MHFELCRGYSRVLTLDGELTELQAFPCVKSFDLCALLAQLFRFTWAHFKVQWHQKPDPEETFGRRILCLLLKILGSKSFSHEWHSLTCSKVKKMKLNPGCNAPSNAVSSGNMSTYRLSAMRSRIRVRFSFVFHALQDVKVS